MWANISEKRALLLSTSKFVEKNQSYNQYQFVQIANSHSVSYCTCDKRVIFWKVMEEDHPQAKPKNNDEWFFVTIPLIVYRVFLLTVPPGFSTKMKMSYSQCELLFGRPNALKYLRPASFFSFWYWKWDRTSKNTLRMRHLHPKNQPTHHKNVSPAEM